MPQHICVSVLKIYLEINTTFFSKCVAYWAILLAEEYEIESDPQVSEVRTDWDSYI